METLSYISPVKRGMECRIRGMSFITDCNFVIAFRSAFDVVFAVLLVFNAIGVLANVLVMLGIKLNKRSLLLPWLVFQLMVILGE